MQSSLTDGARWPWLLVPVLVAVSGAIWWEPWQDEAIVPAADAAPTIAQRVPAPDLSSSGSTPIEPATPTPALTPAAPPALKFVGTVMAGASSFATVRRTTDSQLLQLRVGDRVDGFAVTAIEPERVVLAGPAQPIVIEAARAVAAPESPAVSPAVSSPPASQAEPPAFPDGQAPWDLVPPFGH